MPGKQYYVYIMTTVNNTALYTGVTNDLVRRVYEHKNDMVKGFTTMYRVHKLVYYEIAEDITTAITREKQLKSWKREKKLALVEGFNPGWFDLCDAIDWKSKIKVE